MIIQQSIINFRLLVVLVKFMKKTMIPSIATAFSTGTEARAKAQFRNVHPPQPKGWGYKESAVIEENQSASYKGWGL